MADYKKGDTASWDAQQVRRSSSSSNQNKQTSGQKQTKKRKRGQRTNPVLYVLFVLLTSAILAGVGWLLMTDLCAFNNEYRTVTVEVTSEDTVKTIAKKLEDAELIEYKWFFRLFALVANADEKIGIGTYELNTDMDYRALITGMQNSSGNMNADTVRVTIPEGFTVEQTIALMAEKGVNTKEALTEAAKKSQFQYDYIDNNSQELNRLEGYLFPDTYDFYVNEKPTNALNRLIKNFDQKMDKTIRDKIQSKGYTIKEVVTVASLIEKETDGTDQKRIASVIENRRFGPGDKGGTNGLLQIDAALLYAIPNNGGVLSNADKKMSSPYNLYKHTGLPPTPIANPGMTAIQAALEPESTNYYYYALGKDGHHHFFRTLNEHNQFLNSDQYARS